MKRKLTIALLIVLSIPLLIVGGAYYSMHQISRGYEVDPAEASKELAESLQRDLGYDRLQPEWLKSSWANGFQDHTCLYKLKMPLEEIASLRSKFPPEIATYDGLMFQNGRYLGPSSAPSWWDTKTIDGQPMQLATLNRKLWRLTVIGQSVYLVSIGH
jgi:hypothetical protein